MWWIFALLSAFFAALTAIFAKIGIKGVDTDLATAIRTVVILILAWGIAFFRGGTATLHTLSRQNLLFLCLSGVATGLSWIFYFKALQLERIPLCFCEKGQMRRRSSMSPEIGMASFVEFVTRGCD